VSPDWHAALAYALTGEWLPVRPAPTPDARTLLAELTALGWSGERLAVAARGGRQVPPELMAGLGAAQFWAVLAQLRREIGAGGAVPQAPTGRTRLTVEEQRLRADRPPHW
jgi:hypothetical protein